MTTLALLAGGALWGAIAGAPPAHRAFPELLREFRERRDSGLVAALAAYRRQAPDGRRWEVAYMIAATKCRASSDADRQIGARLMKAFRADYARELVSAGKARAAEAAYQACVAPAATAAVPEDVDWFDASAVRFSTGTGAGVVASGKSQYASCDLGDLVPAFQGFDGEAPQDMADRFARRLFPRADTAAARRATRERLPASIGPWQVLADDRFVLATASRQAPAQQRRILSDLGVTARFLERELGLGLPDTLLTAYLVPSVYALRQLAGEIHGIRTSARIIGYSIAADASLAAVVPATTTGTLHHELTHLALRRTLTDAPPWLDEGLAALYEVSAQRGDRVVGLPNWRGQVMRIYAEYLPAREELLGMDWASFDGGSFGGGPRHAAARYFVLFLQERGWLPAVVRAHRERDPFADVAEGKGERLPSRLARSDALLAEATGRPPEELWRQYQAWLETVLPPPARHRCPRG